MTSGNARIFGAGIAGLAAGLALARQNWSVTIDEKSAEASEIGAGIQLGPNATRILHDWGLAEALKRIGYVPDALRVRRFSDGRILAQTSFSNLAQTYGSPYYTLKRADLHRMLLDAASAAGVSIRFGHAATALSPELKDADLILGADGLHSAIRKSVDANRAPVFTGYEAWRAMQPMPSETLLQGVTMWFGHGKHCVTYPVGAPGERVLNIVFIRQAGAAREGWSNGAAAEDARPFFREACRALRTVVNPVPEWKLWSLFDMQPVRSAAGKTALVGDAGHPVLPFLAQGAGMAIEDAGLLASMIALNGGGPLPAWALNRFADARGARAGRVRDSAKGNGRIYHLSGFRAFARDLAIRSMSGSKLLSRYDWLYDFDSADAARMLMQNPD